jgi:hypothetical protein
MAEAFQHLKSFLSYFQNNDPDMDGSSQVARGVENATNYYKLLYNEKKKPKSSCLWILSSADRTSLAFFKKRCAF